MNLRKADALAADSIISIVSRLLIALSATVVDGLVSRMLGPADKGIYATLILLTTALALLGSLGGEWSVV